MLVPFLRWWKHTDTNRTQRGEATQRALTLVTSCPMQKNHSILLFWLTIKTLPLLAAFFPSIGPIIAANLPFLLAAL